MAHWIRSWTLQGVPATGLSSVQVCFVTWREGTLSPHLYRLKGYFPHIRTQSGALNSEILRAQLQGTGVPLGLAALPPLPPPTISYFMPHRAWLQLAHAFGYGNQGRESMYPGSGLLVWSLGCQGGDWRGPGARAWKARKAGLTGLSPGWPRPWL